MHRTAVLAGTRTRSNERPRASRACAGALAAAFLLLLAPDSHAQGFLRNYVVLTQTVESSLSTVVGQAICPDGLQVLGGGVRSLSQGLGISVAHPNPTSWAGRARRFDASPPVIEMELAVVCGRVENYSIVTETVGADSTNSKSIRADCPPGSSVLGGGVRPSIPQTHPVAITSSVPSGNGWFGRADEVIATDANWSLNVSAICGVVPNRVLLEDDFSLLNSVNSKTAVSPSCGELVPLSGGASVGFDFREVISDLFPTEGGRWTSSAFEPTVHLENWTLRTSVICAPEPDAAMLAVGAMASIGLVARRKRRAQPAGVGSASKSRR